MAGRVSIAFIGAQASGKSTVGRMVAEATAVPWCYVAPARTPDGRQRTPAQLGVDRVLALVLHPRLVVTAAALHRGRWRERVSFALLLARRERFVRKVARTSGGLVDNSPFHAVCQAAERSELVRPDRLLRLLAPMDAYVLFDATPAVLAARFAAREGAEPVDHTGRASRYATIARAGIADLRAELVVVGADAAPGAVASEVVSALAEAGLLPVAAHGAREGTNPGGDRATVLGPGPSGLHAAGRPGSQHQE